MRVDKYFCFWNFWICFVQVFCQRLGLETGWNCHISLADGCATTTILDDRSSSLVSESCPLLPRDPLDVDTESAQSKLAEWSLVSNRVSQNSDYFVILTVMLKALTGLFIFSLKSFNIYSHVRFSFLSQKHDNVKSFFKNEYTNWHEGAKLGFY